MKFGITFDYLCPFARNANEAVLNGMDQGKGWQPRYVAFSLAQAHTSEDEPDVWDEPAGKSGVLSLQWGLAARDNFPDVFAAVHRSLFAARHDEGKDINDESVIRESVAATGADVDAIAEIVASGTPMQALAADHIESVGEWNVFGVPTFLVDDHATFVRFMSRGDVADLQRTLDLLGWTDLNEFKRTTIPR
ncbi:MAG: DsbA family protein [bacterium]|nr:DsbA family protein [bacterium]